MRNLILYISGFLVLVMLQEFVLNNIDFTSYVSLYGFLMVVVMFPLELKPTHLILWSTLAGVILDLLSGTSGLITATLVWSAFIRPLITKLTIPADIRAAGGFPFSSRVGSGNFLKYTFLLSLLFGIAYFTLEVMNLSDIPFTVLRVVISAVANTLLIFLLQLPLGSRR